VEAAGMRSSGALTVCRLSQGPATIFIGHRQRKSLSESLGTADHRPAFLAPLKLSKHCAYRLDGGDEGDHRKRGVAFFLEYETFMVDEKGVFN
jgi:hypothetical protein